MAILICGPSTPVEADGTFEATLTISLPPQDLAPHEIAVETGVSSGPYPRREIHWTSATAGYEGESIPRCDDFEAGETDPVVGGTDGA